MWDGDLGSWTPDDLQQLKWHCCTKVRAGLMQGSSIREAGNTSHICTFGRHWTTKIWSRPLLMVTKIDTWHSPMLKYNNWILISQTLNYQCLLEIPMFRICFLWFLETTLETGKVIFLACNVHFEVISHWNALL